MKMLKFTKIIIFSLILVLVLAAFGCKQSDSGEENGSSSQENGELQEEITYNTAKVEDVVSDSQENTSSQEEESKDDSTNAASSQDKEENGDSTKEEDESSDEEIILLTQAEKLAEIYGTYTNKDKESFKNLKDLKQYATDKLQKWIDKKSEATIDKNAPFYGVTTKALSSAILEKGATDRKIIVTVKKEEITAATSTPKVTYKVILMLFKKSGDDWKLDGIYWQE